MADASFYQSSFLGGIWSQAMQGRMDDPRYRTAMNVCVNGVQLETGAWVRRPGFMFAGRTPSGNPARVISFNFTSSQPYSMEFSDGLIRFRNGIGFVLINTALQVVSISADNPAQVRCRQPHATNNGEYIQFAGLGLTSPTLQNRQFKVTSIDAYTLSIADDIAGSIDGSLLDPLPAGVTAARISQIITTYAKGSTNDWANIRVIQAETQALLLNGQAPNILTALTQPAGAQFATFDYRAVTFVDGPYLDPFNGNDWSSITQSSVALQHTGTSTLQLTATVLGTGVPVPNIFAATDVGRQMRLFTAPPTWQGSVAYSTAQTVLFNGQAFKALANSTGSQPDTDPSKWQLQAGMQAYWIYGTITAFTNSSSVTFQISGPGSYGLAYGNAIEFWRLGVYSTTTGWPTCGCYHEGRVWLGGAVSNRFDASQSNGLAPGSNRILMSPTGVDGTVAISNGITYILNAKDVNQMLWMEPDQQGIVIGTRGGEWLVQATTQNLPLSPTNIQAHRYTTVGCANVEPRRTPLTMVFVQKQGRKVMEFFPDVYSGRFTAPNLTATAKHLTVGGLLELAYQQELSPIVWARRADGTLLGCTYKRENMAARELPAFGAWHQHTLGSGRIVESIATCGNANGTLDTLTTVTNDATNIRWVEVLADIPDENAAITAAWNLDGSVAPSSYQVATVTDVPVGLQVNGLWHLNGKTVSVWAGGLDVNDWPVVNGSITIPFGDGINAGPNGTSNTTGAFRPGGGGYLLTPDFVNAFAGAMPIAVGFTYESDGQILRPNTQAESGARNGPAFGKKRLQSMIAIQAVNTQGVEYGTDFGAGWMQPAYFRDKAGTTYPVNRLFSGIFWDTIEDDWGYDGMLAWRVTRPYPVTIAALGGFPKTNDY